jgi:Fe-S-cluster containining protein
VESFLASFSCRAISAVAPALRAGLLLLVELLLLLSWKFNDYFLNREKVHANTHSTTIVDVVFFKVNDFTSKRKTNIYCYRKGKGMFSLKEEVLLGIYKEFEDWLSEDIVCKKGCTVCCSQNVIITAVEGELIHRNIRKLGREEWMAGKLQEKGNTEKVQLTTNGFAASCLQGEDVMPVSYGNEGPCPFLEEDCCSIYEVRPFSCRCFISEKQCRPGVPAVIGETYLSASSAVMQIVEHLGQGEYFGNMLDVLLALCDLPENRQYRQLLPALLSDQGRANVTKALPLPGFLLMEEEMAKVEPLLEAIFLHEVGDRTIENILNNK